MSQAGINNSSVTVNPAIPTSFTEDVGTAVPVANNLQIKGGVGITTSGSGNTVTITNTGVLTPLTFNTDSTPATESGNTITFHGVGGLLFSGSGATVTGTLASIPNASLANSSVTVTAGTGLSGGGTVALGGTITLNSTATGTVTSVSGTLNRITSTGGTTPIIDISAAYVGQTSITTLGTITTGVWNGTTIAVANGGTGAVTLTGVLTGNGTSAFTASTVTQHGVLVGGASNAVSSTGVGSTGQVLQGVSGADPTYSTATFPSTATGTGTFLRANGTNWVASTSTIPDTFAQGDIIYGSASNVLTALAKDTNATRVLTNTGTSNNPAWAQVTLTSGVTGTLPVANGGTSLATLTAHALYVGNGTSAPNALAVGATGTLLVGATTADPAFATSATGDFTFTSAVAGATRLFVVSNSDNTNAASNATIQALTGGASAGDPRYSASTTTTEWSWGIDNSATVPTADPFVISQGAALGTNNIMTVATSGEINFPLQSAFMALLHTGVSNVTGDGTVYTNIYDTEVFDQNNDFTIASSTYTAPITGRVQFSYQSNLQGGTTITAGIGNIVTSNRTYAEKAYIQMNGTVACCCNIAVLADMDVGDTATTQIQTTDGGGKIDDTPGDASGTRNFFSGYIAC